ncbi:hypothetical protein GN316_01525 [Xylophilus sp. Kf1]|nr:hypothetical protein [Xylophilus sp. Kf1]
MSTVPTVSIPQRFSIQQAQGAAATTVRSMQIGSYQGNQIEVVTGYDAGEDRYAVHAYITAADGVRRKLPMVDHYEDGEREGFARGWNAVAAFFES